MSKYKAVIPKKINNNTTRVASGINFLSETFFPVNPSISEKTILPPSKGMIGIELNTAKKTFTKANKESTFMKPALPIA